MASLAVVDLAPLLRASLAAMANAMGFDPVHEAADVKDLAGRGDDAPRPDLVLIGFPKSPGDVGRRIREIRAWAPDAKVVIVAATLDVRILIGCFTAGACGYLIENISREGLRRSLHLVSAGENVFPSELANALGALTWQLSSSVDAGRELSAVHATDREVEILRCLTRGESNSDIAATLGISEPVVIAEMRQILKMLGLSNRTQAALWAVAKGLAPPLGADEAAGTAPERARSGPSLGGSREPREAAHPIL